MFLFDIYVFEMFSVFFVFAVIIHDEFLPLCRSICDGQQTREPSADILSQRRNTWFFENTRESVQICPTIIRGNTTKWSKSDRTDHLHSFIVHAGHKWPNFRDEWILKEMLYNDVCPCTLLCGNAFFLWFTVNSTIHAALTSSAAPLCRPMRWSTCDTAVNGSVDLKRQNNKMLNLLKLALHHKDTLRSDEAATEGSLRRWMYPTQKSYWLADKYLRTHFPIYLCRSLDENSLDLVRESI